MKNQTRENNQEYSVKKILLIVFSPIIILAAISAAPVLGVIIIGIYCYKFLKNKSKKLKQMREEMQEHENSLLRMGYRKIHDGLFINEEEKKLNIIGKDYFFSQIIDCELVEDMATTHRTYNNSSGKIKSNGKIRMNTNSFTTDDNFCRDMYINIVVDDFENPHITLSVREKGIIIKNGKKYNTMVKKANEIIATLKLVMSKSNQNYVENGTITKIEHRYINEETPEEKLKKLSDLYKSGVLTEYEYNVKKYEILDKIR